VYPEKVTRSPQPQAQKKIGRSVISGRRLALFPTHAKNPRHENRPARLGIAAHEG